MWMGDPLETDSCSCWILKLIATYEILGFE